MAEIKHRNMSLVNSILEGDYAMRVSHLKRRFRSASLPVRERPSKFILHRVGINKISYNGGSGLYRK